MVYSAAYGFRLLGVGMGGSSGLQVFLPDAQGAGVSGMALLSWKGYARRAVAEERLLSRPQQFVTTCSHKTQEW